MLAETVVLSTSGLSDSFPAADYQASAVGLYLSRFGNNYTGLYNASVIAYPDVVACAPNVLVASRGKTVSVDGNCADRHAPNRRAMQRAARRSSSQFQGLRKT